MMRTTRTVIVAAIASLVAAGGARAAVEDIELPDADWSWEGPLGTFDRAQLQRGLQGFTEICLACHSLRLVAYRNLDALGYDEEEIKAYAANFEVQDGPDENGEMFMREAIPSDRFVPPYPNEEAARAANNGAYPPDLSVMTKARKGGAYYVNALLIGYGEAPEDFELMEGMSYNKYFPGRQIAMPQPLFPDAVEYADGTEATEEQIAADITAFLAWAAEPELEERKALGIKVLVFLSIFTVMLIALKRRIWADVKKH